MDIEQVFFGAFSDEMDRLADAGASPINGGIVAEKKRRITADIGKRLPEAPEEILEKRVEAGSESGEGPIKKEGSFAEYLIKSAEDAPETATDKAVRIASGLGGIAAGTGAVAGGVGDRSWWSKPGKVRPKWSHPASKYGRRLQRIGIASLPLAGYTLYRHYARKGKGSEDPKKA